MELVPCWQRTERMSEALGSGNDQAKVVVSCAPLVMFSASWIVTSKMSLMSHCVVLSGLCCVTSFRTRQQHKNKGPPSVNTAGETKGKNVRKNTDSVSFTSFMFQFDLVGGLSV